MNECKIVEDLIPLYAEDLTNEEAAEFVENHVAACDHCRKLLDRCRETVPIREPDGKEYKMAFLKNKFNLICKVVLAFILTLIIGVSAMEKLEYHINWMEGREPVEQVVKAPVGNGVVTVVDWEASGWEIGGVENVGTILWMQTMDVIGDAPETRYSIDVSGDTRPWENVQIYWAPNGIPFLVTADLLEGGSGIYVHAYESWYDEEGGHHSASRFLPSSRGNGLVDVLTALCAENEAFPTGWETLKFTFHQWLSDSETITFVYETDNGHRGLLDYHYPTEAITRVN